MPTFTEPATASTLSPRASRQLVLFGSIASIILIAVGVWQKSVNAYFGAAVLVTAIVLIHLQHRRSQVSREITVNEEGVHIGDRSYSKADLAGFWLWDTEEGTEVNLETPKPAFFPTSFLFPGTSDEARSVFSLYLSELEPRRTAGQNPVDRFLKL